MKPKKCAIVSTPRSGTHFLRFTLDKQSCLQFAGEFFRDRNWREPEHIIKDYVYNNICDASISHLDYVGFVWHLNLESDLQKNKIDKFILLERKNKLEQFVSLKIASETGSFAYTKTTERIVVYPKQFLHYLNNNRSFYSDFRGSTQGYKNVYYEDLCSNFEETIEDINDYLGVRQDPREQGKWGESWFRTKNKETGHDKKEIRHAKGIYLKQETRPMKDVIINYEDVKEYDRFW